MRIFVWLLAIVSIASLLIFTTKVGARNSQQTPKDEYALAAPYWKSQISKIGPAKAYSEMVHLLEHRHPRIQHAGGHAFGRALYESAGTTTMRNCGEDYSWACIHGFMIAHTHAQGPASVPELSKTCERDWNCLHGLGHGLIAEYGYEPSLLEEALSLCTLLTHEVDIDACWSGIIMGFDQNLPETNQPITVEAIEKGERRVGDDLLAPCDTLTQASYVCFYWQSQVWRNSWAQTLSNTGMAKKMGELCSSLKGRDRDYCFAGTGNTLSAVVNHDPDRLIALCDSTSDSYPDQVLCRSFGARMTGVRISKAVGTAICNSLSEPARASCLRDMEGPYAIPKRLNQ